jgi:dTMP kinase
MSLDLKTRQRGKFIVIEGGDSSGKHTQAELLLKHIQLRQSNIELLSFPKYDTPFGDLVAKYLRGEYGSLHELPPEIPSLLYAMDRYQVKDALEKGLVAGKWFIADRYTQSNLGHQSAKFSGEERKRFITWLEHMESRLPQPDLIIYLHVPVEIAQELMQNREHKKYMDADKNQDIHELDKDYQQRVVDTYLELATARDNWVVIDCIDKSENKLKTIQRIHQDIVKIVNERLGI